MSDRNPKLPKGGWTLLWILLILGCALALIRCEPSLAGGTSEIGNPQSALYHDPKKDTGESKIIGFGFNAGGIPITIVREKPEAPKDSATADSSAQER